MRDAVTDKWIANPLMVGEYPMPVAVTASEWRHNWTVTQEYDTNVAWLEERIDDPEYLPSGEYNWVMEWTFTYLCVLEAWLDNMRETLAEYKREVLPNYMTW